MGRYVTQMRKKSAYRILVGKSGGRTLIGRPRNRLVRIIKMGLRDIVWGSI
jgi:hypothetical protein